MAKERTEKSGFIVGLNKGHVRRRSPTPIFINPLSASDDRTFI
jgi:hypothetical protein